MSSSSLRVETKTLLRAVVFDFDGVIADSEPLHLRAYQDVLAPRGIALRADDYYARYLGFADDGAFRRIGEDTGRRWTDADLRALVAEKASRFEEIEHEMSTLFPGAADAVRRIAAAVPIAIASGARGDEIRRVLEREALSDLFTAIVSADDTRTSKPAPDPYLHAVARLSARLGPIAAADCVAIEDSVWGIESARAAGLRTVAVTHSYKAADLASADRVLASIAAVDVEMLRSLCSM